MLVILVLVCVDCLWEVKMCWISYVIDELVCIEIEMFAIVVISCNVSYVMMYADNNGYVRRYLHWSVMLEWNDNELNMVSCFWMSTVKKKVV